MWFCFCMPGDIHVSGSYFGSGFTLNALIVTTGTLSVSQSGTGSNSLISNNALIGSGNNAIL